VANDEPVAAAVQQVVDRLERIDHQVNKCRYRLDGYEETPSRRPGGIRHQRLRRHAHGERGPAAHTSSGRRTHQQPVLHLRDHRGAAPGLDAAFKSAVEGYTESLDHEVREHGVWDFLGHRRSGDRDRGQTATPHAVAKAIVTAATDPKPSRSE
jgi:hypothetical protein